MFTSLSSRFLPFAQEPWRFRRLPSSGRHRPWFLPLMQASTPTLSFKPLPSFWLHSSMKLVYEIKTKPVTQASIIIALVACCLLFWLAGLDCQLFPEPFGQHLLCNCLGCYLPLGPMFSSTLMSNVNNGCPHR